MKTKIKLLLINVLEFLRLKTPRVLSPARLSGDLPMRLHSLSVLTDLAVRNVHKKNLPELCMAEAGIGFGETFSFLSFVADELSVELYGFDSFK